MNHYTLPYFFFKLEYLAWAPNIWVATFALALAIEGFIKHMSLRETVWFYFCGVTGLVIFLPVMWFVLCFGLYVWAIPGAIILTILGFGNEWWTLPVGLFATLVGWFVVAVMRAPAFRTIKM